MSELKIYRKEGLPEHCLSIISSKEEEGYRFVRVIITPEDDITTIHFVNPCEEDAYYTLEN